jgi:hypothetical protein
VDVWRTGTAILHNSVLQRPGRGVAAVLTALLVAGCDSAGGLVDAADRAGPTGQGAAVVVAEGEVAGHTWGYQLRDSHEGPVLQWLRDGRIQGTSWNFTRTPDEARPVIASGGAPHADPDDPDSAPLYVELSAIVSPSLDEVVFVFADGEVIARRRPSVLAPGEGWAPVAATTATLDRTVWVVGCTWGRRAGADLAWTGGAEGSFERLDQRVC